MKLFLATILLATLTIHSINAQSLIDQTKILIEDEKQKLKKAINNVQNSGSKKKLPNIKDVIIDDLDPTSIMLTNEEQDKVNQAIDAYITNKPLQKEREIKKVKNKQLKPDVEPVKEQSRIYLNAILYISKNSWITWINGNKITNENNKKNNAIYIKSINNKQAKIRWKMGISKWRVLSGRKNPDTEIYKINKINNQIEIDFTLKTNQTYNLVNNKVTEGKFKIKTQSKDTQQTEEE